MGVNRWNRFDLDHYRLWYSGRNPGSPPPGGGVGAPCRPADPRRPCYFWDFFDPKWSKNRFFGGQKMAQKWPKNGPKMAKNGPKTAKNGPKSPGGAQKNPKKSEKNRKNGRKRPHRAPRHCTKKSKNALKMMKKASQNGPNMVQQWPTNDVTGEPQKLPRYSKELLTAQMERRRRSAPPPRCIFVRGSL